MTKAIETPATQAAQPFSLFEVSWEVANKVGGIHTVLSTKARTLVERLGDEYIVIGPWLLRDEAHSMPFDEERGFEAFTEGCRQAGVPVRVGRWRIPGSPRTLLVEFSGLIDRKNDILSRLWEDFAVDSLSGDWDYLEPVLFGHAAAIVIERWWEEFLAPRHRWGIAQFHEWMTGSGLLRLKRTTPSIGTVFTTHATMLGRAMSSLGISPDDGLGDRTAADLATEHRVVAKHSIEGVCAREADVFTTVSEVTAKEAELLHARRPEPILPNGIDLSVIDELAGPVLREEARSRLVEFATRFLGQDVSRDAHFAISGRYEFHNKGIDLLLESLARLASDSPRPVTLWILVPAGNSGPCAGLIDRAERPLDELLASGASAVGITTHNLFDGANDPVAQACRTLGLSNARDQRVKIVHVPIYLSPDDGWLNLPYEAVLRAMDLTCFPSYYEPWGYTPQESLAVGVPTITSDYAGFGRWVEAQGLGPDDGVRVLHRVRVEWEQVVQRLADELGSFLAEPPDADEILEACRTTARRTEWSDLIANYDRAFDAALKAVRARLEAGVPLRRRPQKPVAVRAPEAAAGPRLVPFEVAATLPAQLAGLERLARNLWWCWDVDAKSLFHDLSPRSWAAAKHNPVRMLMRVFPEDVEARSRDEKYLARLRTALARLDAYLARPFVASQDGPGYEADHPIAYFSAEFGIHESLRIYSGGLGVLAGDHLKSASDLALPLVAVSLFYRFGYMTQRLTTKGEQVVVDEENRPEELPIQLVRSASGTPLEVEISLPGRKLALRAWKLAVGRVPLYLLDTDTPSNRPEDREITRNLYGGDQETRLKQEIVLGRGGTRLLEALGIRPSVWHINEGHAAFLTLERVSRLVGKSGWTFDEARELVRRSTAFTTHTPVPAGHDRFGEDLMRRYFSDASEWVGLPWERFLELGRAPRATSVPHAIHADGDKPKAEVTGDGASFNMTYLALSFASRVNGVAKLHGVASRSLLHPFWPQLIEEEVPVHTVTNGIHLATWTSPDIARELGADGRVLAPEDFLGAAGRVPRSRLWELRREAKTRLLNQVRASLRKSFLTRGDSPRLLSELLEGLREDALYIGFARRFAPYKRAHLVFQDFERLRAILEHETRPVRLLVAGKAHPADTRGQEILRSIAERSRSGELAGRVVFLEDYGMDLATALVQGVDVWLNNPTRMQEASGTSGMKAAANGALNLSIADGWWPEAADGRNGWTIADGRVYQDQELQDQFDSDALYALLEDEIVPLFFERDSTGVPRGWIDRCLHCLESIPPVFNTDRMVREYGEFAYQPLSRAWRELTDGSRDRARGLAADIARVRSGFDALRIVSAQVADLGEARVGDALEARLEVDLASLTPADVVVELVVGHGLDADDLVRPTVVELTLVGEATGKTCLFEGALPIARSGPQAYGLRVRPRPARFGDSLVGLMRWA